MLAYSERHNTMSEQRYSQLATTIRTLREGAGLSQRHLSELTGVPEPTIFRLELDRVAHPSFDMVLPITNYFGISPNDTATLLGYWTAQRDTDLTPKLEAILNTLDNLIAVADLQAQNEIADTLDIVVAILVNKHANKLPASIKPVISKEAINKLPKFLRDKFTR